MSQFVFEDCLNLFPMQRAQITSHLSQNKVTTGNPENKQ